MTLAAILVVYFLSLGSAGLGTQDQGAASQTQTPPAPSATPAPASSAPAAPAQNSADSESAASAKPKPKQNTHRKKSSPPDCSTPSSSSPSSTATSGAANAGSTATKPCPARKVVVKNGGSEEPIVELKGDTTAEKASDQRSTTEQLTLGTEENLKKIAGRQLSPSQQDTVTQIKQFMDQSKTALAAGDVERGHNLAMKARLLSDELVKP